MGSTVNFTESQEASSMVPVPAPAGVGADPLPAATHSLQGWSSVLSRHVGW